MAGQREDFMVREIDRLRAHVARLLNPPQPPAELDRALQLALELQVKLFPLAAEKFLAHPPANQFERLCQDQPAKVAAEKAATYAELLFHTATLYDLREQVELAAGARQLALHIALLTERKFRNPDAASLVELLATAVSRAELTPDAATLLDQFRASRS